MDYFFKEVLMDGFTDMIFVHKVENEEEFRFLFVNKAAMRRLHVTDEILGLTIKEVETKEKAAFLYEQYRYVVAHKTSYTYEDSYEENGGLGATYYSETILTPLFDEQGSVDRIVAVVRDITKEKAALSYVKEMVSSLAESDERYHSLFFHNPDGIFILNKKGYITDGNEAIESITGYKVTELVGKSFADLIDTDDASLLDKIIDEAVTGTHKNSDLVIKSKDGNLSNIILKVIPLFIDGDVIGLYGILKDVTEHMKNIEELEESEENFRIIAENAHDLITLINRAGEITYVSPSYKTILGHDYKEYIGKHFSHNIHPNDLGRLIDSAVKSMQSGKPFTIEFRQKNAAEEMVWCESIGKPVFNHKNKFQHLVVLTRDINSRKEYELKLKHFAYHDSLTGLPNRILFKERFAVAKEHFLKNNNGLAFIMLDIDLFKTINDTYGHEIGDMVIKEFGLRIKESIRGHDTVARLGGDEFVVLLSNIQNAENALEMAERIQKKMQQPWEIADVKLTVTTSMGIAMAPFSPNLSMNELMKKADIALYEAKDSGRNSYKLYTGL
ncbi:MAG: diguanylate cyclase domain-containing protein [Lysinibacillus sp.]